tara:strand:- start:185 stop:376 length:192 start_codon:yes stop_codon:yes gene_type:complete
MTTLDNLLDPNPCKKEKGKRVMTFLPKADPKASYRQCWADHRNAPKRELSKNKKHLINCNCRV